MSLLQLLRAAGLSYSTTWPGEGGTGPVSHLQGSLPNSNSIVPPFVMTSPCENQLY